MKSVWPFSDPPTKNQQLHFLCQLTIPVGLRRTKTLRQIAETAPYFRDGQAPTLDVVEFYDRGGDPEGTFLGGPKEIRPLHLTGEEKENLKEFLKTWARSGRDADGNYQWEAHPGPAPE